MYSIKNYLATFTLLLLCSIQAQDFQTQKLNQFFDALEENNKFMGSVGVMIDDSIVYYRGLGFCDIEKQHKPDITSKYRIGSISKTFTAILIMKAIEMEKLSLDRKLTDFFPSFPRGSEITIEQMLSHKSGIHNFTSDSLYTTYNTQPKNRKEMVEIITANPLDFEPNSQYAYSNSNYVLLSYILEDVFDQPYSEVLEEYITQPLGLTQTTIDNTIHSERNECLSYELFYLDNYKIGTSTDASIPIGAGGISSSVQDLLKFGNALFSEKLVSKASLKTMKDFENNIGKGLFRVPFYNKSGYGHTGGIDRFRSAMFYFPSKNLTYVLYSNGNNYVTNDITIAVLSAAYDKQIDIPNFKSYEIEKSILPKFTGTFTSKDIPMAIEIFLENDVLFGQGTGQSSFIIEPKDDLTLKNTSIGVEMTFEDNYDTFVLMQNGMSFKFTRKD